MSQLFTAVKAFPYTRATVERRGNKYVVTVLTSEGQKEMQRATEKAAVRLANEVTK
tara:strand:- start:32 stop:199 length:168 start_codon:yes stop_codon:yes gene_type:complete